MIFRDTSPFGDLCMRIAERVSADYPGSLPEVLEICLHLTIRGTPEIRYPEQPGVTEALTEVAIYYCDLWRAQDLATSVQYSYRPSDVRRVLETVFGGKEHWAEGWVPEDAESIKSSADSLDLHCDVSWAVDQLPRNYRRVLLLEFGLREDPNPVAVADAVRACVDALNNYRGGRRGEGVYEGGHPGNSGWGPTLYQRRRVPVEAV